MHPNGFFFVTKNIDTVYKQGNHEGQQLNPLGIWRELFRYMVLLYPLLYLSFEVVTFLNVK